MLGQHMLKEQHRQRCFNLSVMVIKIEVHIRL
jgi:hypothetical protein